MFRRRAEVLAALLLVPALAGCFGGDAEPAQPAADAEPATNATAVNATLPDGRGQALAFNETNKTETGVGGMEHLHDYWQGRETVVVLDKRVYVSYLPLFPDGEGTQPHQVAYVKLPNGSLVYEGTERVSVQIADPLIHPLTTQPGAPYATPPAVTLQYLTAADNAWRDAGALAWGAPLDIPVAPRETDMPHSTASLWVFRLATDRPGPPMTVHVTVTIHKGRDVVDWPGHPDFYADGARRVVLDTTIQTRVSGVAENILLYDQTGTWANPEKLISWGTSYLEVTVTVKDVQNELDAAPTSYYLEYHNATVIGPEINMGESARDADPPGSLDGEWTFVVPVEEYGMDGPYQPESRWGFRVRATYGNGQLCPGCFSYDIEYAIRIVAVHDPAYEAPA